MKAQFVEFPSFINLVGNGTLVIGNESGLAYEGHNREEYQAGFKTIKRIQKWSLNHPIYIVHLHWVHHLNGYQLEVLAYAQPKFVEWQQEMTASDMMHLEDVLDEASTEISKLLLKDRRNRPGAKDGDLHN